MPCNSDYMEPTEAEQNSKEVCEHLVYIRREVVKHTPDVPLLPLRVVQAAEDYYGAPELLDELTDALCRACTALENNHRYLYILYDGKRKEARRLADWWEEHKKADEKRRKKEAQKDMDEDFTIWWYEQKADGQ